MFEPTGSYNLDISYVYVLGQCFLCVLYVNCIMSVTLRNYRGQECDVLNPLWVRDKVFKELTVLVTITSRKY